MSKDVQVQVLSPAQGCDQGNAGSHTAAPGTTTTRCGTGDVVPVRLDAALCAAVEERADDDHTPTSGVIREPLRSDLEVA